jgi:hypothetical protein
VTDLSQPQFLTAAVLGWRRIANARIERPVLDFRVPEVAGQTK